MNNKIEKPFKARISNIHSFVGLIYNSIKYTELEMDKIYYRDSENETFLKTYDCLVKYDTYQDMNIFCKKLQIIYLKNYKKFEKLFANYLKIRKNKIDRQVNILLLKKFI
jgi:hypothetical protein